MLECRSAVLKIVHMYESSAYRMLNLKAGDAYVAQSFRKTAQESISKVIVIKDCSAQIFRAFLKFLYTDILPSLEEPITLSP